MIISAPDVPVWAELKIRGRKMMKSHTGIPQHLKLALGIISSDQRGITIGGVVPDDHNSRRCS
jgi:hypothetical protein